MFRHIQGNARACMLVEPLFIIPYSLFMTYASVYMFMLGLNEMQIGFITSIGLIVQIVSSFLSGFLTDWLGRKNALLVFDLFSWSVATLLWSISQNFWFFLFAAIINGFQKIPHTAWTCLIVEDTEPKKRSAVFTVLQFITVVGGLFAPLAGLLVSQMSLIPAMRVMYAIAFISMTTMFIIRHFTTVESEIGIRKRKNSGQLNIGEEWKRYIELAKSIIENKQLMIIFMVYILFQFQLVLQNTYLSIYLVDVLAFRDSTIALFPAISSICMLVLLIVVIPKFKEERQHQYMIVGFVCSILALILLLFAQQGGLPTVIISTILLATGLLLSNPYLETAVANAIEDDNRANMFSILQVFLLLFISPAGIIGGITYKLDPKIPFLLMVIALAFSTFLIYKLIKQSKNINKAALPF
ncbi:MFS transporter [Halalkalibacter urbisdiaboli]|uniref:MFS transporter n=1 Tax=Halalkalibacter urbisdiaboli TaxID=1960589 RepID=UPI001FD9C3B0|nr:MFS transporter [Halalkalibacter urbisdiaboli]